jgi:hypothetical protein
MGANDNVYITPIHNKKIWKYNKQSRMKLPIQDEVGSMLYTCLAIH